MQIAIKSIRIIKEGFQSDGKTPFKWVSVMADDGSEKGTEYTTFDASALKLGPGSVIDIGEIEIKEGKCKFKKVEKVISEGKASEAPPLPGAGRETSPEEWKEKQRIERASFEAQTAFKGIIDLALVHIGAGIDPAGLDSFKDDYGLAMAWARARLGSAAPLAVVPQGNGNGGPIEIDWTPIPNAGELFSRCKNYNISRDEALEIFPSPMNDFNAAWAKIVKVKLQIEKPIRKEE